MSLLTRLPVLALFPALLAPGAPSTARTTAPRGTAPQPLVMRVSGDRDAAAPFRVVASGGTLTAGGVTRAVASDTARVTGPAELTTAGLVGVATFVADRRADFLSVTVRRGNEQVMAARGEMVVVIYTPQGPQIVAMAAPPEVRAEH